VRLMEQVHLEAETRPVEQRTEVSWKNPALPGLKDFHFRIVAADASGNLSEASAVVVGQVIDDQRPEPPAWNPPVPGPTPESIVLSWTSPITDLSCLVQRRRSGEERWRNSSAWLARGIYTFTDSDRVPGAVYQYRLRAMDRGGRLNRDFLIL